MSQKMTDTIMQIEVDFEVWQALTTMRKTETDTYNDVLRRLLKLKSRRIGKNTASAGANDWTYKNVTLGEGTDLRFPYKGVAHKARIKRGKIELSSGDRFTSPSAAACAITNTTVNGWKCWEVRHEIGRWVLLDSLR